MLSRLIKKLCYLIKEKNLLGFLFLGTMISFAIFAGTHQKDGWFGYRNDSKYRVNRIFDEISSIIEPYHWDKSKSYRRGPTNFVYFEISDFELEGAASNVSQGDGKDKVDAFFDKFDGNSTKLGFVKGCRDGESLFIAVSWGNRRVEKITVEWKYPSESCISKQKKDKF